VSWFASLRIYLLVAAATLIALSYKVANLTSSDSELRRGAQLMAQRVREVAAEMENAVERDFRRGQVNQKWINREYLEQASGLPFTLLLYRNDSLMFWSRHNTIPLQPVSALSDSIGFEKLKNGYYLTFKKMQPGRGEKNITRVAIAPIKFEYQTTNAYLRNHFGDLFAFPSYFEVSITAQEGYVPVELKTGSPLFYLGINDVSRRDKPGLISPLLFMAGLFCLLLFVNTIVVSASAKRWWLRPLIWSLFFAAATLVLNRQQLLPDDVKNWSVFNPVLFASSGIATSIGALWLGLLFLLWISIDFTYQVQIRLRTASNSVMNYLLHLLGYFLIFFMVIYTVSIIRALVVDSRIEFAFINPLQPDYFSILGVSCIALLLLCLFLLSEKVISILNRNPVSRWDRILLLLFCTSAAITYYFIFNVGISGMWVMLWTILFITLLSVFRIRFGVASTFFRVFIWLVFFASSGALLLFQYGNEKEKGLRLVYAKKLISDQDNVTEFLLGEMQQKIERDAVVISYYETPQLVTKQLIDRLRNHYFQEGFSRYNIRFFPFDQNGLLLPGFGEDFGFVTENGLKSNKMLAGAANLFYSLSSSGNITYLLQNNVRRNDSLIGRLYIELKADVFRSAGVYPELLLPNEDRAPSSVSDYSYAIYNKKQLIDHRGEFYYDYKFPWKIDEHQEVQYHHTAEADHLIYQPQANISIVVSQANNAITYFLSFFSFLFVVMFCLGIGVLFFSAVRKYPAESAVQAFFREAPLRSLIHGFFLLFILAMLVVIGYVTGQYFLKQFNQLAKTTVHEKLDLASDAVTELLQQTKGFSTDAYSIREVIRNNISRLAESQDNEVNVYSRTGDLIASSQPGIFERGILSRRINPLVRYELTRETKTELVTEEQIGELKFYSGYSTVRNSTGEVLLFINIPYYNSRKNLNKQVGFFFIALVNILVIATIIAGLLAPLISRQITARLALIGEKFRKVNVGSMNETIDWPANDEIGSLVAEYNRMIQQLEQSAHSLARTQRELAWREMAKQVAHEIKNPLTPMKLSIQHLQRAYRDHAPNLRELTEKVTHTLIEQIDTLSEIATEFSNFAKMPRPEIEPVDVNDILKSACDLHAKSEQAAIHWHGHAERCIVSADKGQLMRVFNNLILNAIQAIPEGRQGQVNVITENLDGTLVVSVNDNGVGIAEEEKSRVFIPNFTTKTSGTGLGLAMSKNIVESFGGHIFFSSQPEKGTTFFVRLPLADAPSLN
jgi:signal transduction histidine kinase